MATDAEKLAKAILEAHISVSWWPYPPKRIEIPVPEWEEIRKLAKKIQGDEND